MSKAGAFLTALAVIAALVGCTEGPVSRYDLTISASEGGSVTTPGPGTFTYDRDIVVSLAAGAEQGHQFVNWTGDVGAVDDVDAAETTITMKADYSITANFEPIPIVQCDLTVLSTAGGSVTAPGEGVFTYESDTVVDLVAVADECHEFKGWTGDTDGIADPGAASTTISITIGEEAARTVTASFAPLQYRLTIDSEELGLVVNPGEGTFIYDCGTTVNLVAGPAMHCRFVGWAGDVENIDDVDALETTVLIDEDLTVTARFEVIPMVTAGVWHTVGLMSDGTVVATGYNGYGQCEVADWTDIVQVAAGACHTVGLKADGTVIAAGGSDEGESNVGDWMDVVQVDAGKQFSVGLRSDGTLVAAGCNEYRQCDVAGWTGIVQIAAGFYHTVGLRPDGTVVAVGATGEGRLEVGGWTGVVQVGAGAHHSLGLRPEGTVLAVGRNNYGETDIGDWTSVVQVAGGCQVTLGVKANGAVVAAGWNEYGQCDVAGWSDIIQVDAGIAHAVGLKTDGTVVAAGYSSAGRCNVDDWMLG